MTTLDNLLLTGRKLDENFATGRHDSYRHDDHRHFALFIFQEFRHS
jgi:hypothetical protein